MELCAWPAAVASGSTRIVPGGGWLCAADAVEAASATQAAMCAAALGLGRPAECQCRAARAAAPA